MNTGENITNAAKVIQRTYENISKLLKDVDDEASAAGYSSISPRFLRYKSDNDITGWMINGFIKLYQAKEDPMIPDGSGLSNGPIYGVDVTLHDPEYSYPTLTLAKYVYGAGYLEDWQKLPSVSDHWGFYYPTRNKEFMAFVEVGHGFVRGNLQPGKPEGTYRGLEEVLFLRKELLSVSGREKIHGEIIQVFDVLKGFGR